MTQVRLIAMRELREKLRSKAFLGMNAFLLLLVAAAVVVPGLLDDGTPDELTLAVVGDEAAQVARLAADQAPAFDYDLQVVETGSEAEASALVEREDADLALLDGRRLASLDDPSDRARNLLEGARRVALLDEALAAAGIPREQRGGLIQPPPLEVQLLGEASTDEPEEGVLLTGLAVVFVLYGLLVFYGQQVAQGMVQEKQSRVIEVLLAAVRPVHLLSGKLLGLGLLGLGQIVLLGATAIIGLQLSGRGEIPPAAVPTVVAGVVWFLLGYALYATIFALSAAVVARIEDLQTAMMGPIILLIGALFASQLAVADPDGRIARIGGVLPPVAPIYQPLTFALGTASPWRMGLAALGVVATTAALVPITARVHTGASLAVRNRITVREALRRSER